ncbi:hypothetical protein [Curtobacterium sp. RRHDQ10]|uniref:hypothetical protein n=1 Tax=Curtobacterium phyllosphaerae TaxID=3413379 RepID=UPI003BF10B45
MEEETPVAKADALWYRGDRAAALALLRDRARIRPDDHRLRLALAERYRSIGAPDQAGRWGITVEGWTTARERDRAARLVAASGVHEADLTSFLALPEGPLPVAVAVAELLPDVDAYRERFRQTARERLTASAPDRLEDASDVVGIIGVLLFALTVLATWAASALDGDATGFARWGSVTALCVMTLSPAFRSARWVRARRWRRAVAYAVITVVLATSVVGLIANGVAHDGQIVFRWKD